METVAKYTYIALIFIANLLLLAHTVVPHHHHHGVPHFVLFETHSHDDAGDCCCKHGDREACLFEQDIDAVYEHQEENGLLVSGIIHSHPEMFLQAAVCAAFIYDFSPVRETDSFPKLPYLISYDCDYAGSGRGLRAPPAGSCQV